MPIRPNFLKKITSAAVIPPVLLMLLVAPMAHAQTTPPVTPPTTGPLPVAFECNSDIYTASLSNPNEPLKTTLQTVDLYTEGVLSLVSVDEVESYQYNAMAYNPADNFIYAVKSYPSTGELLRIGQGGVIQVWAILSDLIGTQPIAAEFDDNGHMYIATTEKLFKYKVDPELPEPKLIQPAIEITAGMTFADIGLYDGYLWGISTQRIAGAPYTEYRIVKIDPADLSIQYSSVKKVQLPGANFTSVYAAMNGVYAYDTGAGSFVKMKGLATGDPEQITLEPLAKGVQASGSDGAKCQTTPLGLPADIAVTKTAEQSAIVPGQPITYTLKVENLGPWGADEIVLSDPMPAGVTGASWSCTSASVSAACVPASGTGDLHATIALLEAGAFVTYEITFQTDPAFKGEIVNIASITVPPDFADEPANNIARSPAAVSELEVIKTGKWIDVNNNGAPEPGEPVEFTFTVSNGTTVDITNVTISDPMVASITPSSIATLLPGQSSMLVGTYYLTAQDIETEKVTNVASASGYIGDTKIDSEEANAEVTLPAPLPDLYTEKSSAFLDDLIPNELPDVGERIEFRVKVQNLGNVDMTVFQPIDEGPTFNGVKGTGTLGPFSPVSHVVPREGGEAEFVAYYVLTSDDIGNAAGLEGGVMNTVLTPAQTPQDVALGVPPTVYPLPKPAIATLPGYLINKTAQLPTVMRGQQVPYVITVTPKETSGIVTIVDRTPKGFLLLPGSARVDGKPHEPRIEGAMMSFDIKVVEEVRIEYVLVATGTATLGTHKNLAQVFQPGDITKPISVIASDEVDVIPDPIFDCGDVIGKVFDDRNRNGYQDSGEPGVAGARVVTIHGIAITTDDHGRFNLACADLPDARVGSTYLMKLDARSLPTGYRIISENPRSVRLTAGKVQRINFATSVGRVVRLDVNDAAFLPGQPSLHPDWEGRLLELVQMLESEPSVLRLSYISAEAERALAGQRLAHLRSAISSLWKTRSNRYRLEIEARMLSSSDQAILQPATPH